MNPSDLNLVLLIATCVLLAGVAAVRVSTRAGLPSLLLYLAIGLAIGESGLEATKALPSLFAARTRCPGTFPSLPLVGPPARAMYCANTRQGSRPQPSASRWLCSRMCRRAAVA